MDFHRRDKHAVRAPQHHRGMFTRSMPVQ